MRLQPFHRNFGKRLIKTPKLNFLDPGLTAWLAGVRDAAALVAGPMRGPLFETILISEFVKRCRRRMQVRPLGCRGLVRAPREIHGSGRRISLPSRLRRR